ncbi:MAG TPA: cytochrome P450 [Pseudonocardiaceae bacterium]|nr:cytochrome P450 [Pseudonocardiaceae bacterium]
MTDVGTMARFARAPGWWPLLGHSLPLHRDPLRFLAGLPAYGELVEIGVGPTRMVVVCDPGLAHQVITDLRTFDRVGMVYDRVRAAMGNGLATAVHAEHRRQRLVMQPAFHPRHLPGYAAIMREQAAGLVARWRDGQCVDMVEEMFQLTTSVALRALFSSHTDGEAARRLREAFDVFLRGTYARVTVPGFDRLPLPANRRYAAALRQWRAQVRDLITRYRAAGGEQDDLMGRLLAAPEQLTDTQLCDQVAVLLLAGAETTSSALSWSVYLLCRHPDVLAAVRAEADRVLAGRAADWADLPKLELTGRVVLESMRLYPPSWVLLRSVTSDTRLGGHLLRAGSMVVFSPYVLHRHPGLFAEPERFEPDRWSAAVARHAYVPFGGGATKCVGEQFALAEASVALASILGAWTPSLVDPDTPPATSVRLVLAPRRLPVRLHRRDRTRSTS